MVPEAMAHCLTGSNTMMLADNQQSNGMSTHDGVAEAADGVHDGDCAVGHGVQLHGNQKTTGSMVENTSQVTPLSSRITPVSSDKAGSTQALSQKLSLPGPPGSGRTARSGWA